MCKIRNLNSLFGKYREINGAMIVQEKNRHTSGIVVFSRSSREYLEGPMMEARVYFVWGVRTAAQMVSKLLPPCPSRVPGVWMRRAEGWSRERSVCVEVPINQAIRRVVAFFRVPWVAFGVRVDGRAG